VVKVDCNVCISNHSAETADQKYLKKIEELKPGDVICYRNQACPARITKVFNGGIKIKIDTYIFPHKIHEEQRIQICPFARSKY
jgi:hypothetical protein